MSLSVVIITRNEERNIGRTLASVAWADERIIVDSGSADRTLEIAREQGAKVFAESWKGYAQQKNSAIAKASSDWILSIDADEEVSAELAESIRRVVSDPTSNVAGYFIARRNLFLGRWIRYGGFYPDRKLRLSRRGTGQFVERAVHETMRVEGPTAALEGDLIHNAYPTLTAYIESMNRYSSLGAEVALQKGQVSDSWLSFLVNVYYRPALNFSWNYFFRLGFLDGREGYLLHLYHNVYVSWKYAKAWEAARNQTISDRAIGDKQNQDNSKFLI
ncbi:MAG: glycosyltransferase family 2 protein [Acidobacteria bacterium]|nr:MAG: glycosyltransferase family 2 protein [Acidobacteriota bacterium]